jgi:hypothetical protein
MQLLKTISEITVDAFTVIILMRFLISKKPTSNHSETVLLAALNLANTLVYWLSPFTSNFLFFHIISNAIFISKLGPLRHLSSKILIPIFIFITILLTYSSGGYLLKISYCLSIYYLVKKALKKCKSNNKNIETGSVYILLSIEHFTTFIILLMKDISTNWHQSHYLKYFSFLPIIIFPLTFIVINAKFRRLFLA